MKTLTIQVPPDLDQLAKKLQMRPCHKKGAVGKFLRDVAEAEIAGTDLQAWSDGAMRDYLDNEAKAFGVEPAEESPEPEYAVGREGTDG